MSASRTGIAGGASPTLCCCFWDAVHVLYLYLAQMSCETSPFNRTEEWLILHLSLLSRSQLNHSNENRSKYFVMNYPEFFFLPAFAVFLTWEAHLRHNVSFPKDFYVRYPGDRGGIVCCFLIHFPPSHLHSHLSSHIKAELVKQGKEALTELQWQYFCLFSYRRFTL